MVRIRFKEKEGKEDARGTDTEKRNNTDPLKLDFPLKIFVLEITEK